MGGGGKGVGVVWGGGRGGEGEMTETFIKGKYVGQLHRKLLM